MDGSKIDPFAAGADAMLEASEAALARDADTSVWPFVGEAINRLRAARKALKSTTETTDQRRPVVNPVARIDLDEIEREHRAVEWQRCDADGVPNPEHPLAPFCAACTDEEYVGAIEYGDTIDEAADVVSWPCRLVELAAEVRRLRDQVAELEALRRADITVIGHLGVAVPRAEAERDAAVARVAAARRALLQGGQLAEIRCRAALVALDDGRG